MNAILIDVKNAGCKIQIEFFKTKSKHGSACFFRLGLFSEHYFDNFAVCFAHTLLG